MSMPPSSTRPASGAARRRASAASVDLPEPDGPRTATRGTWRHLHRQAVEHRRPIRLPAEAHSVEAQGGVARQGDGCHGIGGQDRPRRGEAHPARAGGGIAREGAGPRQAADGFEAGDGQEGRGDRDGGRSASRE